ncbi:MAG: Zn-ribbon domain-containing OB-fold protein [Candidatus Freyarchaeum deiterrae]
MHVSKFWRELPQRYRLEGKKCAQCGKVCFPPRDVCPDCNSNHMIKMALPKTGKIITYTIMHTVPSNFEIFKPYMIALLELDDGTHLTTQLTDCKPEDITLGMDVEAVIRKVSEDGKDGIIYYAYKFRPLFKKNTLKKPS